MKEQATFQAFSNNPEAAFASLSTMGRSPYLKELVALSIKTEIPRTPQLKTISGVIMKACFSQLLWDNHQACFVTDEERC